MAIIYTYPTKATPNDNDLILISDSEDSNKTKQVKISTLPGGSGSGVSSVTAVLPLASTGGGTPAISLTGLTGFGTTGQVIKVNSNADGLEWGAAGGSTLPGGSDHSVQYKNGSAFAGGNDLTFHPTNNIFSVKHTVIVKGQGNGNPAGRLKLNCEQDSHAITLEGPAHSGGADYTLKFPSAAPNNTQILQSNNSGQLSWITTPSGGGGGVSQVTAGGVLGTSSGAPISISPTTGNVVVTSQAYAGMTNVGHVPSGGDATKFLRGDATWVIPTNTTYSAGTGLSLNTNTFSLATNAALTNLGGGTGTTFLKKDGTWASPTTSNTNIGGNNLILTNNRTLNFYSDTTDKSLTFIGGDSSGTKTLFKFDTVTNKPRLTIGDTASTYEGTLDITGNGSNRTGKINLYNAAGTYSINIQAPTTFGASSDIPYVLPNTQGGASTFLQNNGSGTLTWAAPTTAITLTTTGSSGAATWDGTTLNIPQYSGGGGSSASLGFTPLSIYAADDLTVASYTYYCLLVCDVDITLSTSANAKVFVRSGTSAIYAALYSTTSGNMQTSSFTRLCTFSKISGVASGINILPIDSTVTLTAGQTIMLGFSSANQMAGGGAINSNILSVEDTSLTTSFPASIASIENTTTASKRVAIHIYES